MPSISSPLKVHANWSAVTPNSRKQLEIPTYSSHIPPPSCYPSLPEPYRPLDHSHQYQTDTQHTMNHNSHHTISSSTSNAQSHFDRYTPYPIVPRSAHPFHHTSYTNQDPPSGRESDGPQLDIPCVSVRLPRPPPPHPSQSINLHRRASNGNHPITPPTPNSFRRGCNDDCSSRASPTYALPPISALLEDLRGIHANDAAAVLKRLREDDAEGSYPEPDRRRGALTEEQRQAKRRSLSAPMFK